MDMMYQSPGAVSAPTPGPVPARTDPLAALGVLLSLAVALAVGAAVYLWRREARKTDAAIAALQEQERTRRGGASDKDVRALRAEMQSLTSRLYDPKGLTFRINEQAQFNNDVYLGKDRRLCLTDGSSPVCLTNKDFAAVKAIKP